MKIEITRVAPDDAYRGGRDIRIAVFQTKYEQVCLPMMNDEEFENFKQVICQYHSKLCNVPPQEVVLPPIPILKYNQIDIWSCMACSALVRFVLDGLFQTAYITHATTKSVRIYNPEIGAAWVPLYIMQWSVATQQYIVTDEEYVFNFTQDIHPSMKCIPTDIYAEMLNDLPLIADQLHHTL